MLVVEWSSHVGGSGVIRGNELISRKKSLNITIFSVGKLNPSIIPGIEYDISISYRQKDYQHHPDVLISSGINKINKMINKNRLITGCYILIYNLSLLTLIVCCQSQKTKNIKDNSGNDKTLKYSVYAGFKESIEGRILERTDLDYESGRKIWNLARYDLKPAIIIQCINATDVVKSVNFVRQNDLLFSVKGGGHNSSAFSLNDNGVVIDLSMMKNIVINSGKKNNCCWTWIDMG